MAATPRHYVLRANADADACVLDRFPTIRDYVWQATEGAAVGAASRGSIQLPMSRRLGGKALADLVPNTLGFLMLSERAATFLRKAATAPIEYLPIVIVDHKERRVPVPFYIANVLGSVDCVDRRASRFEESALRKGEFFSIERLVLDPARLDPTRNVFRIRQMPQLILVSTDLAAQLRQASLAGLDLVDPEGPLES